MPSLALTHTRSRQVLDRRTAEPAGTDDEHTRLAQAQLRLDAEARQHELAAVPRILGVRQWQWRRRHGCGHILECGAWPGRGCETRCPAHLKLKVRRERVTCGRSSSHAVPRGAHRGVAPGHGQPAPRGDRDGGGRDRERAALESLRGAGKQARSCTKCLLHPCSPSRASAARNAPPRARLAKLAACIKHFPGPRWLLMLKRKPSGQDST